MRFTFYIFVVIQSIALVGSVVGLFNLGWLVIIPTVMYLLHLPIVFGLAYIKMSNFKIKIDTEI